MFVVVCMSNLLLLSSDKGFPRAALCMHAVPLEQREEGKRSSSKFQGNGRSRRGRVSSSSFRSSFCIPPAARDRPRDQKENMLGLDGPCQDLQGQLLGDCKNEIWAMFSHEFTV